MSLKRRLETILNNIEKTKQSSSINNEILLVAATKTRPLSKIEEVYSLGVRQIGENRIQEAVSKFDSFETMPEITRRFIGHWKEGRMHGYGSVIYTDGTVLKEGRWKDGFFLRESASQEVLAQM
mgnify:CR=1 FL=1